uniref:Uncharacterized protein n=1 Tax=Anguilla anguilla TaxID=7936 RepID=A0A0E9QLF7_ANGAN
MGKFKFLSMLTDIHTISTTYYSIAHTKHIQKSIKKNSINTKIAIHKDCMTVALPILVFDLPHKMANISPIQYKLHKRLNL